MSTQKANTINYSAPPGKQYNASMMTGQTAATTNYQDEASFAGGFTNLDMSPNKTQSASKKGKQGDLRPSTSGSPTKNKRL